LIRLFSGLLEVVKTELILKFKFDASHALSCYETPHPHLWKLEVAITGTPIQGWLVDLMAVSQKIDFLLDDLRGTYLNENEKANQQIRDYPTCESLGPFLYEKIQNLLNNEFSSQNPTLAVSSILVSLHTPDGEELGAVKVS